MTRGVEIEPAWQARLAAAGLPALTSLLKGDSAPECGGTWRKLSKPGLGARERWHWELPGGTGDALYVKRYLRTPVREQIDRVRRQAAGHSRAWWEYTQSAELRNRHVPAVRAIGVAEELCGPFECRSVVLFEAAPGDAFDRVWPVFVRERSSLVRAPARHELTRCLARFVSAFHQTGLCHRDLYLCHIFADLDATGARPPRFTLIDLARTHRPYWRRFRWIVKDLSQLDCSARQIGATGTDRLRFLAAYLGLEPSAPRLRYYARCVVRKSDAILRRLARRSGSP